MLTPYKQYLVRLYCIEKQILFRILTRKRSVLIYNSLGFQVFKLRYLIELFSKKLAEKLKQ